MTQPRDSLEPANPLRPAPRSEQPAPGGHAELQRQVAHGAVPAVPGMPPVSTPVPVPASRPGHTVPGVQLAQRTRHRGDTFGWPANAAPGKPEGEVDTRP
jgi:hypothetical protein